jgi:hypothetical protein
MESERYTTRQMNNSRDSELLTSRDRLDYAMERAKVLFGCYRRGDANDPDQYVASIAAVLTLYEPDLVREATDPRSGISTDEKFCNYMPNSGQLKVYCDAIRDRRARVSHLGSLSLKPAAPRLADRSAGRNANVFVPTDSAHYQRCAKIAKLADAADWKLDPGGRAGIWIALNLFNGSERRNGAFKPVSAPTDAELRAHYGAREAAA